MYIKLFVHRIQCDYSVYNFVEEEMGHLLSKFSPDYAWEIAHFQASIHRIQCLETLCF